MDRLPLEVIAACFNANPDPDASDLQERAHLCLIQRRWLRVAQLCLHARVHFEVLSNPNKPSNKPTPWQNVYKFFERCRADRELANACASFGLSWLMESFKASPRLMLHFIEADTDGNRAKRLQST